MSVTTMFVTDEDREAIAWVREHGGLDYVKSEWRSRVPYDRYERRRQRLLDHIAECETALGRRRRRIEELGHRASDLTRENAELRKRAMPAGYEWPTVDGKPVDFVTGYKPSLGVLEAVSIYSNGACEVMGHDGIIKPVSEIHVVVPAADGEPLEVGQTVYVIANGKTHHVTEVDAVSKRFRSMEQVDGSHWLDPMCFTHQRPVLDADGRPIREDERVFGINGGLYRVTSAHDGKVFARYVNGPFGAEVESAGGEGLYRLRADQLTHTKPEPPDSAERIADEIDRLREEVALHLGDYLYDEDGNDSIQFSMELVAKRCRALAERERGE